MTNNRFLILSLILCLSVGCEKNEENKNENIQARFEWKQTIRNSDDFKENLDSLVNKVKNGDYGYIDEVFISKNDSMVYEAKFKLNYAEISKDKKGKMGCGSNMCEDSSEINIYNYYHPKFHPYYKKTDIHTLQSITKSIVSTIVGTAIQNEKIKGVNDTIYHFFKDEKLSKSTRNHLQKTTLKDVLTMQLGLEWNEFGMSLEEETNVAEMELSENWINYVLNQPIKNEPGKAWNYNSGASQLLSQIVKKASKKPIDEYGNQTLFEKLNIETFFWKKTPSGLPDTEGGLYLKAEDLAKIGLLYLKNGVWNGERLLPKNWVKEALGKEVTDIYKDGGKEGYGYQWWITGDEPPLAVGLGYGNQILVIIPETNVVGVIYAWNVFDNDAKYIFRDFVDVLMKIKPKF